MPIFDINQIPEPKNITNHLVFHTPTKEIYNKLMKVLEEKGWFWKMGSKPTLPDYFRIHESKMHIMLTVEKYICYCSTGGNCNNCSNSACNGNPHYDLNIEVPTSNIQLGSPKNNDGRSICYWCNIPTQKRGGGIYDICPQCGK